MSRLALLLCGILLGAFAVPVVVGAHHNPPPGCGCLQPREATTPFVSDTFTGSAGDSLEDHHGELGANWSQHPASLDRALLTSTGDVRPAHKTDIAVYLASGTAASADYTVSADLRFASKAGVSNTGILARWDTTTATGYEARWYRTTDNWEIDKFVNGAGEVLSSSHTPLTAAGDIDHIDFTATGSLLVLKVNGTTVASTVDCSVTGPGRVGLRTHSTEANGVHIDNFVASE